MPESNPTPCVRAPAQTGSHPTGTESYPRFCRRRRPWPPASCRHLSRRPAAQSGRTAADCGLPGIARPHPLRCDEIPPPALARLRAEPTRLAPGCTLAQPAASQRPLVGSYPTLSPLTQRRRREDVPPWAGLLSVAVVVVRPLPDARPHLRFRGATSPALLQAGWESGSSSTGAGSGSDGDSTRLYASVVDTDGVLLVRCSCASGRTNSIPPGPPAVKLEMGRRTWQPMRPEPNDRPATQRRQGAKESQRTATARKTSTRMNTDKRG